MNTQQPRKDLIMSSNKFNYLLSFGSKNPDDTNFKVTYEKHYFPRSTDVKKYCKKRVRDTGATNFIIRKIKDDNKKLLVCNGNN